MPRNKPGPHVEQLEFDGDLKQENADLRQERDDLLRENQDLRERDGDERSSSPGQLGDSDMRPGWFMVTVAALVIGRVALFHFVEHDTVLPITRYMNGLFMIVGAVVLVKWIIAAWQAIAWGVVSKSTFVLVSLACAITNITVHPYGATIYILLALLFAASPGWERMMGMLLVFVHHPLETIGRFKK